jgi:hypothetical protein
MLANTPIECPRGSVALSMPTRRGFIDATPRPKLYAKPCPEPPLRKKRWYLYAKRPFADPKAVLAYLCSAQEVLAGLVERVTFHEAKNG